MNAFSLKMFSLVAALVSSTVFAQEIGTEITPTTPNSGVQQQPQNPPPADQPKSGYVYKPQGSQQNAASNAAGNAEAGPTGPKASASSGDFGLRAGFGASGVPSIGTGAGTTVAAPSLGIAYFAGDAFKLLVDLGFGMILSSSTPFALSATLGFDYMFRTPADAMRPFFHAAASFLMSGTGSNIGVGVGAQLGFGAEYFFAPAWSVNARLLLAVPMSFANGALVGIFTVTPGVGATWYL